MILDVGALDKTKKLRGGQSQLSLGFDATKFGKGDNKNGTSPAVKKGLKSSRPFFVNFPSRQHHFRNDMNSTLIPHK